MPPPSSLPSSPRARMLAALNAELGAALEAGDVEAARVAHEAIGKLLGADGGRGEVADLSAERAKRNR